MPMKVEAAVITQKGLNAEFNCDSVNINGKVLPREVILNGYKGAGVMSDSVFFALSHSDIEGFADAAVAAFNDRASGFAQNISAADIITGFFDDSISALKEMNKQSSDLICSVLYAAGRSVLIGKTGDISVYSYSQGTLSSVEPEHKLYDDGQASYGLNLYRNVVVDDIFILLSPGLSSVLTDKDMADICRIAEGSVKKIVNLVNKVSLAKNNSLSSTVIAVKILETELIPANNIEGFMTFSENEENVSEEERNDSSIDEQQNTSAPAENTAQSDAAEQTFFGHTNLASLIASDDDFDDPEFDNVLLKSDDSVAWLEGSKGSPDSGKNKTKIIIAVVAAIIIVGLLAVVAFSGKLFGKNNPEEKETTEITTEETTKEEKTTVEESTTEEESTTGEESTTDEPSTSSYWFAAGSSTRSATPSSTRSAVPSTQAPTTAAPTTSAPTTAAPTTAAPTTAAPTTEAPTTSAPTTETPSSEPVSSEAPVSQTEAPPVTEAPQPSEAPVTDEPAPSDEPADIPVVDDDTDDEPLFG